LQNAAEQLEYFDLLHQAAETQDAVERMCYVAAFAVSGYAHTRLRSGRKSLSVCFICFLIIVADIFCTYQTLRGEAILCLLKHLKTSE
jgi:hypothetical protein